MTESEGTERMGRRRREQAILEIVEETPIRTQEELVEALAAQGISVAQSTVSRDVRRLGLVRAPLPDGSLRYARPGASGSGGGEARERLRRLVESEVVGAASGDALLVVKTPPGSADAVAIAIDDADLAGVAGTVAGDDTILVLLRDAEARDRLLELLEGGG